MQLDLEFKEALEKNIFENNLFDSEFFDNDYYFDFSACKKSSKFPEDNFTNFFKNRKELYKYVKKEHYKFSNMVFDSQDGILEEYEIKNFGGKRMKLLTKIISDNMDKKVERLPIIYRLCNKFNKELQFYYYEASEHVYRIVAVDLFHLLMPANDKERHDVKNDGVFRYKENEKNDICLSEIFRNDN